MSNRRGKRQTYDQGEEVDRLRAIDLLSDKVIIQSARPSSIRQHDVAEGHTTPLKVPANRHSARMAYVVTSFATHQNAIEEAHSDSNSPNTK